eukprot:1615323-Pyramimonas_sp.AAC.2
MKRTLGHWSLAGERSLWFHILCTVFRVGHAGILFLLFVEVVDIERVLTIEKLLITTLRGYWSLKGYCSPCEAEDIEKLLIIAACWICTSLHTVISQIVHAGVVAPRWF